MLLLVAHLVFHLLVQLVELVVALVLVQLVVARLYQLIGSRPGAGQHHQHKLVEVDVAIIVLVRLGKH